MRIDRALFLALPSLGVLSVGAASAGSANPLASQLPVAGVEQPHGVAPVADANPPPIVSGRSASAHRRSKMHHVRIDPDGIEAAADEVR